MSTIDRRRAPRFDAVIGCKIREPGRLAFDPAESLNISRTGILLRRRAVAPLAEGDRVQVAIALRSRGLIGSAELVDAVVRRAGPLLNGEQRIAAAFEAEVADVDARLADGIRSAA